MAFWSQWSFTNCANVTFSTFRLSNWLRINIKKKKTEKSEKHQEDKQRMDPSSKDRGHTMDITCKEHNNIDITNWKVSSCCFQVQWTWQHGHKHLWSTVPIFSPCDIPYFLNFMGQNFTKHIFVSNLDEATQRNRTGRSRTSPINCFLLPLAILKMSLQLSGNME